MILIQHLHRFLIRFFCIMAIGAGTNLAATAQTFDAQTLDALPDNMLADSLNQSAFQTKLNAMQTAATNAEMCVRQYLNDQEFQYYTRSTQQMLPQLRQLCSFGKTNDARMLMQQLNSSPKVKQANHACIGHKKTLSAAMEDVIRLLPAGTQDTISPLLVDIQRTEANPCPKL